MTQRELKQAVQLLGDQVRRAEVIGISGGVALSVEFASDGEQKIFHTLREVMDHVESQWFRVATNEGTYSAEEAHAKTGVGDPAYANCYRWENVRGEVRHTGCNPAEMPGYWREFRGDLDDAKRELSRLKGVPSCR